MSFAQRNSTLNTFSLFTITYYLQKNSSAEGEKWRVKREEWRGKKISSEQVRGIFLVAEVGFEPHDLRVMSPTSYQAALLRDMGFSFAYDIIPYVFSLVNPFFAFFFLFLPLFCFFARRGGLHGYCMRARGRFMHRGASFLEKTGSNPAPIGNGYCLLVPVTGIEPVRCFRITGF